MVATLAAGLLAAVVSPERHLSEGLAPPSPPPASFNKQVDWYVLLYVLGPLYALVMIGVLWNVCCSGRGGGTDSSNTTQLTLTDGGVSTSIFTYRTVDRGKSALFGQSGGGRFSLGAIEKSIRMAFLRKVYGILATQLLVTMGLIILFLGLAFENFDPMARTPFYDGVSSHYWVTLVALIPLIALICVLQCVKNTYPINYVVLFLFTAVEGCVLGIICISYFAAGYGDQVILAAALTFGIFIALTLYTLQSRIDWSFLGPILFVSLFVLFFWSFFTFWLVGVDDGFRWQQILSLIFALVFVGFIVYDTHMIMKHFGVDDYVIAAIELYLDVINLFLFLLRALSGGRN